MPNEKSNTNTTHVESVKEPLYVASNQSAAVLLLPLEHTTGDSCDSRVMSCLDRLEELGKLFVILVNLGWPCNVVIFLWIRIVSSFHWDAHFLAIAIHPCSGRTETAAHRVLLETGNGRRCGPKDGSIFCILLVWEELVQRRVWHGFREWDTSRVENFGEFGRYPWRWKVDEFLCEFVSAMNRGISSSM